MPVFNTTLEGKSRKQFLLNDLTSKVTSWYALTTKETQPLHKLTWPILIGSGQAGPSSIDFGKPSHKVIMKINWE